MADNIKCINGVALKIIGIATMLIDHIGAVLFPGQMGFRIIGRIAFPIFLFLIVEGFSHTRNVKKYIWRMILFALISEAAFDLAIYDQLYYWKHQNVFATLALGLILLMLYEKAAGKRVIQILLVAGAAAAAWVLHTDYGGCGILLCFLIYIFRGKLLKQILSFLIVSFIFFGLLECAGVMAFVPIALYNGKRGAYNTAVKYLFYLFYPAHLLILALIGGHIP